VGWNPLNEQVRLEVLVDILVDRSFGLVMSEVILAFRDMELNKHKATVISLLLVHFFDGLLSGLGLLEANETRVRQRIFLVVSLDNSR
jgi:hypothetical protein